MTEAAQAFNFHGRLNVAVRTLLAPTAQGRSENQDNYLIIDADGQARFLHNQRETHRQIESWVSGHCRFAILDGMGGHSHGREATELAVASLLSLSPTANLGELSDQLEAIHLQLHRQMHKNGAEPGCTLTLLEVPPVGPALLFHTGDSRFYAIDHERAAYLTIDHIPATKFALFGLLDAEEWHRQTHQSSGFQISQAFILGNSLSTRNLFGETLDEGLFELHDGNLPAFLRGLGDRRTLELRSDCTYLLASDGLWHLSQPLEFIKVWPELLSGNNKPLANQLDDLFQALIQATAREPGLRGDNSTAIALRRLA